MSIANSCLALAIVAAASATAGAVGAPDMVAAPQALEYLNIQHMSENFGFPFSVLILAAAGSLVGAWNQQQDTRKGVTVTFLVSTVLAICAVVLVPEFAKYEWRNSGVQATAAMALGFTAQNWGPAVINFIGPGMKNYLRRFLPQKEGDR
jgi:hypothetical protein